ncbi:hypothetical protein [uncultured Prevotella sp.]|jgi:hypothetical protein|uniref:hypothetical protein n=1 Tax=uncultured Prevotella sp. TaxID=159272 RepID=UPI0020683FBE|nr:hypothetical protein [uncultured Prevotella sp.]DAJ04025.1 MAG TPA: hypothetical protein [Caudoviricetes sp.]
MTKTLDDIPLISERRKKLLPAGRKAQKEFIRDLLSTNQEKFEELFSELAEHDPKAWLLLYHDMQKHVVPKQSQLNVSVGINKDFQELQALSTTKTDDPLAIGANPVPRIEDADFEELKEYEGL